MIAKSPSALTEQEQRPGTGYVGDADSADELSKRIEDDLKGKVDEVRPDAADEFRCRIEADFGERVDEERPEAGASRLAEAVKAGLSTSEMHGVAAIVLQCAIRVRAAIHRWLAHIQPRNLKHQPCTISPPPKIDQILKTNISESSIVSPAV